MKRYTPVWLLIALCALLVVAGNAPITPVSRAVAQEETVYPTVTPPVDFEGNGGDAEWEVEEPEYVSNFPEGMTFSVKATSSGGEIKSASLFWQLSPSTRRSLGGVYDETSETWVATWNTDYLLPSWVGFQYWFVLVDEAGNTFITTPKTDEWADNTRSWGRAESEDVVILWERPIPDIIGEQVTEAMRESREVYLGAFGSLINYKPRVIIYATRASYAEWHPTSTGAGEVGTTSSQWGGTAQYLYNGDTYSIAYGAVLHEIAHLYQNYTRTQFGPVWWIEGGASFFEKVQSMQRGRSYNDVARRIVESGAVSSLRNDVGGGTGSRPYYYDVGYSFIFYVVETYGIEAYREINMLVQSGTKLFDAFEQATGEDFDTLDYNWRVWLGVSNPVVPTLLPTMEVKFRPTPTLRTFGPRRTATPTAVP